MNQSNRSAALPDRREQPRDEIAVHGGCVAAWPVLQHTDACDDCVVSILLGPEEPSAVIVDVMEVRAMRMLQDAGLVPALRFRRRVS